MRSQYCRQCHQWIKLEEPVNRPAAQLPELAANRRNDAEPDKEREKKYLTYASRSYYFHKSAQLIVALAGLSDS